MADEQTLKDALADLLTAVLDYESTDPDMPSHKNTLVLYENAKRKAAKILKTYGIGIEVD